jgi:hypothetical protein
VSTASERDECRRDVAARGLTPTAIAQLTEDALGRIDLDRLAPLKALLKRFFSDAPWTAADDAELAEIVGPGDGWWEHRLDDVDFAFGWREGAFRLDLSVPVDATFAGTVVPEATPNPRTIRFVTGPIHDGPSRWYTSPDGVDDARAARVFEAFDDVANVLVGPDFVAVGLHHPDRWEQLLAQMLHVIEAQFVGSTASALPDVVPRASASARADSSSDRSTALEAAWRELGKLQPDAPGDLERIRAAAASSDAAARQVAARLFADADLATATAAWRTLLDDPSRRVRRATVDAMVDTEESALRPLLEHALADADAWTRWKALRGLIDLGAAPSLAAIAPLAADPDFRVRLEVAAAQRGVDH